MTPAPPPPGPRPRSIPHEARLLSLIAANIRDMVLFVDLDGRIQWVNEAVENQFGYSREELIGAHVYMLQAPGKNPPGIWSSRGAGELLDKWTGVIVDRRKDGAEFTARVESFLVRDEGGDVVGLASISRDISDRVRADADLRESERRYREFFTTSRDSVFITTRKGEWIDFNDAALEMFGYANREELSKVPIVSLYADPADRPLFLSLIEKQGSVKEYPVRLRRRDGTIIDTLITSKFRRGPSGSGGEYFGTIRDITERTRAEESLRVTGAQLSNALKIACAGHWEYDVGSDTFTFNDNFYRIFRTTAEQVGGYTMSSADYARRFCHPDDVALVGKEVQAAIETADPQYSRRIEHRIVYANGEIGYIAVRFFVVKDRQGRTVGTCGVNQDITEQKRVEQALRESEERFRMLTSSAQDAIIIMDGEGRISFWNASAEKIFGYTAAEAMGKELHPLLVPAEYLGAYRKGMEAYRITGTGPAVGKTLELTAKNKDGTIFPIELSLSSVKLRGAWHAIGILRDITRRKEADEEVRAGRTFLRDVIDANPNLIFVRDGRGRYLLVNKALADAYGTAADAMIGKTDSDLGALPDEAAAYSRNDREVLETGREKFTAKERFTRRAGKTRFYQTTRRPLKDEAGMVTRVLVVSVDITEREDSKHALEDRNLELEIISDAALNREFRIKELRDEIRALRERLAGGGDGD